MYRSTAFFINQAVEHAPETLELGHNKRTDAED